MGWKRGSIVMEAKPYVLVLHPEYRERRCDYCLTSTMGLKKCGACKRIWYCGVTCQKADWSIHKLECKVLREHEGSFPDAPRLFLRLVIRYLAGAASVKQLKDESPCVRVFSDLMSHLDNIKADPLQAAEMQEAIALLRLFAQDILQLPDDHTLSEIFGKMTVNSFAVYNEAPHEALMEIATAIYISPSIIDHRCWPNACPSYDGRKVRIRALEDIASDSLSDVFTTYLTDNLTTAERQEELQRKYFFTCDCATCTSKELDTLMCSTEGSNEGDLLKVQQCRDKAKSMYQEYAKPKAILDMRLQCLNEIKLPSGNVLLLRLWQETMANAIDAQEWDVYLEMAMKVYEVVKVTTWPHDPYVGYLLGSIGEMLLNQKKFAKAADYYQKALDIICVPLGEDHLAYKAFTKKLMLCQSAGSSAGENGRCWRA